MAYEICENDVRLLRRRMACLLLGNEKAAKKIEKHLRDKGLNFGDYVADYWLKKQDVQTQRLIGEFGCTWLEDHSEGVYLNSGWRNPRTLYVRLVEELPELGELGKRFYDPAEGKGYSE